MSLQYWITEAKADLIKNLTTEQLAEVIREAREDHVKTVCDSLTSWNKSDTNYTLCELITKYFDKQITAEAEANHKAAQEAYRDDQDEQRDDNRREAA